MNQDGNWLKALFKIIDSEDAVAFGDFLTEDAVFVYGNNPEVVGRGAVVDFVSGFFASLGSLEHSIESSIIRGDCIVCKGTVTYYRVNGSSLSIPFCNWLTLDSGLIKDYRIFADASELYQ